MLKNILHLYLLLPLVALVLGIFFVFAAEDKYRYECQDPANWDEAYCHPPLCNAVAACTEDLIYNGMSVLSDVQTSGIDVESIFTPEEPSSDATLSEDQITDILTDIEQQEPQQ